MDDWDDEEPRELEPEDCADESCVECGGQGGWCGSFDEHGQCVWVWCACVDWSCVGKVEP